MVLRPRLYVTVVIILLNVVRAQNVNQNLCPDGPILTSDASWRPVPPRFEIWTELVTDSEVAELSQAFSLKKDTIMFRIQGNRTQLYWDFVTYEQLEVLPIVIENETVLKCSREVIESDTSTSIIQPNTLFVKPSILLGYDADNQFYLQWGVSKIGNSIVRGVRTNVFKSCFYVSDIRATVSAIYQVSNITQSQTYSSNNNSVILEINVKVVADNGRSSSYKYNVFKYIPNPSRREQRLSLDTPPGVFCSNRTSTSIVPTQLADRIGFNNEFLVSEANLSIFSSNQFFDQSFKFARFDLWIPNPSEPDKTHFTELHDFGTGLSYKYDHQTRQCKVDDIQLDMGDTVVVANQPNMLQMSNGLDPFLMKDIIYQYTGEKQCRDRVTCHVWIGEKPILNNTGFEQREWYWAFLVNGELLQQLIPMRLILTRLNPLRRVISSTEINLFSFHRNPPASFEIYNTMADCYRAISPKEKFNFAVMSFIVDNDKEYPVYTHMEYLRYQVWETLIHFMEIRPIRIPNVIIDYDGKMLLVTFTVLDTPPRLGPVESPLQERSLINIVAHLRTIISKGLAFRARYAQSIKQVILRARNNSLQVIYTRFEQNQNQNIEIIYKTSGPEITAFWIGFIILGCVIGIVVGIFVAKYFSK